MPRAADISVPLPPAFAGLLDSIAAAVARAVVDELRATRDADLEALRAEVRALAAAKQPAPAPQEPGLLQIREVARRAGVSASTIRRWVDEGRFPAGRVTGPNSVRWLAADVQRWIEER